MKSHWSGVLGLLLLAGTVGAQENAQVTITLDELQRTQAELRAVRAESERLEKPPAEVSFILSEALYRGVVTRTGIDLEVTLKLSMRGEGRARLDLFDNSVALVSAEVPAGLLLTPTNNGVRLEGRAPGTWEVRFRLAVPAEKGRAAFGIPRAGASNLQLTLPGPSAVARITPSGGESRRVVANATVIAAAIPPTDQLAIEWSALGGDVAEAGDGPVGRQYLQSLTAVTLSRDMLYGRTRLKYEIRGGNARLFQLELPSAMRIVDARGEAIDRWQSRVAGEKQILELLPGTPVTAATQILVDWEMPVGDETTFVVPRPSGLGVERQSGAMAVSAGVGVEVEASAAEEMTPFDPREAPGELANLSARPFAFAARFQGTAGRFIVGIRRPEAVPVKVAELTEVIGRSAWLSSGKIVTYLRGQISNLAADQVTMTIPADATLWQARVDETPIRPRQGASPDVIRLPLTRPDTSGAVSHQIVELLYVQEQGPLSWLGRSSIAPPRFSLPVGRIAWSVHLPEESRRVYALADFMRDYLEDGNWRPAALPGDAIEILGFPNASLGGPQVAVERHALAADEAISPIRVYAATSSAGSFLGGIVLLVSLWLTVTLWKSGDLTPGRRRALIGFLALCLLDQWLFGLAIRRLLQGVILGLLYAAVRHIIERWTANGARHTL